MITIDAIFNVIRLIIDCLDDETKCLGVILDLEKTLAQLITIFCFEKWRELVSEDLGGQD